jgi:hypothetical protein
MLKLALGLAAAVFVLDAALAADTRLTRRHVGVHTYSYYLPPERHVVEGVYVPGSGTFLINGRYFVARTPACMRWLPGERITLLQGDWNGACATAVFYNVPRRMACEMAC